MTPTERQHAELRRQWIYAQGCSGWSRFQSQFRETDAERKKRLRESYRKQQATYKCTKGHDRCDASANPAWDGSNQHAVTITLQHGPVTEGKPPNGVTVEALLAIVADGLRSATAKERAIIDTRHVKALAGVLAALDALKEA